MKILLVILAALLISIEPVSLVGIDETRSFSHHLSQNEYAASKLPEGSGSSKKPNKELSGVTAERVSALNLRLDKKREKYYLEVKDFFVHELGYPGLRDSPITLRVDYQIIYNDLVAANTDSLCYDGLLPIAVQHLEAQIGSHCLSDLFHGRPVKDWEKEYCNHHSVELNTTLTVEINVHLDHVLPFQMYDMNISIFVGDPKAHFNAALSNIHCTYDARPAHPPISHPTAFDQYVFNYTLYKPSSYFNSTELERYHNATKNGIDEELVNIYWSPLPNIYAGARDFHYLVRCKYDEKSAFKLTGIPKDVTKLQLSKPINEQLSCLVHSENHINKSSNFTRIVVPSRAARLNLGVGFRLAVYEITSINYRIEWVPFIVHSSKNSSKHVEYLARKSSESSRSGESLQLYWCTKEITGECGEFEGFVTIPNTTSSSYDLTFPEYSDISQRRFGIAYMQLDPYVSSGIVWDKCGPIAPGLNPMRTMRVTSKIETRDGDKLVVISWSFLECDPIVLSIDAYEFNYCQAPQSEICGLFGTQSSKADPVKFPFETSSHSCETRRSINKFYENETLLKIEPETIYYIRARYILSNGTHSPWSTPITVHGWSCEMSWFLYLLMLIILILGAASYRKGRIWYRHLESIFHRFKDTRAHVSDIVDMKAKQGPELLAKKWCVNRETIESAGELSINMLDHMVQDNIEDDRNKNMDQSFDYIPRNRIEKNSNETTPENSSESMRDTTKCDNSSEHDEISISSQSSFLNNILDETLNADPSFESNN